jgi:hypothetical protein
MNATRRSARVAVSLLLTIALNPEPVAAHCDGMDGPVVSAAQAALASGDVDQVLVWVQPADEDEIRRAFARALAVRGLSPEAQELADVYFFETLVRVHRAGEGAPYTGLKPAGRDLAPAIPLADRVLTTGAIDPLVELVTEEARTGLIRSFDRAVQARNHRTASVEAGRAYVDAYVGFIHYVERAYEAAREPAVGHFPEKEHVRQAHPQ